MNTKRIIPLVLAAVLAAGPASPQPLPLPPPFQHSELQRVWEAIGQSRTLDQVADRLRDRFGRLPWTFTGNIAMGHQRDGTQAYREATVRILNLRDDLDGRVLGLPSVVLEYEIVEPAHLGGVMTIRRPYQRGAM